MRKSQPVPMGAQNSHDWDVCCYGYVASSSASSSTSNVDRGGYWNWRARSRNGESSHQWGTVRNTWPCSELSDLAAELNACCQALEFISTLPSD
eukprot:6458905-Amphidinium_carterae.1